MGARNMAGSGGRVFDEVLAGRGDQLGSVTGIHLPI